MLAEKRIAVGGVVQEHFGQGFAFEQRESVRSLPSRLNQIENVIEKRRAFRPESSTGLKELKRGAAFVIERDDFAIEHGFVVETFCRASVIARKFEVRSLSLRERVRCSAVFDGESADAVEFQLVKPFVAFGQFFDEQRLSWARRKRSHRSGRRSRSDLFVRLSGLVIRDFRASGIRPFGFDCLRDSGERCVLAVGAVALPLRIVVDGNLVHGAPG